MADDIESLRAYREKSDARAFARLVGRYAGLVYGAAFRITGNPPDAEDITQEVFLRLADERNGCPRSIPAWLHTIATHLALNRVRVEARRRHHEQAAAAARTETAADTPSWQDLSPHVDAALTKLPEDLRDLLVRHFLQGRSQVEIAAALGVNQSTVSRHVDKSVGLLRAELKRAGVVVPVALLVTLLSANAASAAPTTVVAALCKAALAGAGKGIAAGTAASATTAAGTAGGTGAATAATATAATGGIGIMKLSLIGLAAATVVTVGIVGLNSRAEQRPASNTLPVIHAEPPLPPDESKAVWDESDGVRPRHQIDVEARLCVLTREAAEELRLGDLSTVRILSTERIDGLVRDIKNRSDARETTAPHVLGLCGREQLVELTTTGAYVSGYERIPPRSGADPASGYLIPRVSSYEVAATRFIVTPETNGKQVSFMHLAMRFEQNTLVPCEIKGVHNGKEFTADVSETVTDTLLAQLDDKTVANLRLKHGESVLIPAKFSRTKPPVRIDYPYPVQKRRGDDPPPMLGDDETAFALVTPTLLLVEEVAPGDATPTRPPGDFARDIVEQSEQALRRQSWQAIYEADKRNRENEKIRLRARLIRPGSTEERPMTPQERLHHEALDRRIDAFSFEETPLYEVVNYFKLLPQFENINFVVDDAALGGQEMFITRTMNDVTLRQALTAMFGPRNLQFIVANDAIFISNAEGIRRIEASDVNLYFHQYDITDILVHWTAGSSHWGEDAFVRVLAQATGPWNWDWVGGTGNNGVPVASAGNAQAVLVFRNGYLMAQQTPALQDAVSGILAELRTSVGRSFRRASNPCTLAGKVVSGETGLPVEQAEVFVFYPKTCEGFFLTTAEDGNFEFDHIPVGEYFLMAAAPGFAVFPHERTGADRNTLVPIEIPAEEPRKELVFELQPLPLDATEE